MRQFEKDCEKWDGSQNNLLPAKVGGAERPERELISVLNDLPGDVVKVVSPNSLNLRKFIKVPLILFVLGASMLASLSDL